MLCIVFFALLFSADAFAQVPTITAVSPTNVSTRTTITITGTNFLTTTSVKFGGTAAASFTIVNNTTITAFATTSGAVTVTRATGTATGPAITMATNTAVANASALNRIITDYGASGYWSSTTTSATPANQPDTRHNLLAFGVLAGSVTTVYSTGAADANLNTRVTYTAGDFRAFPFTTVPGSTSASSFLAMANTIDGSAGTTNYLASTIINLRVKDVLTDGIKGLDIGTGLTNVSTGANFEFSINGIVTSKIADTEPDIVLAQIADPSTATTVDYYMFTDASGNVVGNVVNTGFKTIAAIGTYKVDLFTLASGQSYATVPPSGNGAAGAATRDIRMIGLNLSDFGITTANASFVTKFKVYSGGDNDVPFYSYNANAITIIPVITTHPVSQAVCTNAGTNVTFTVAATGDGLSYQWKKNGTNIPGATSTSYTITNVALSDLADYTAVVSNVGGNVTSNTASLTSITATSTTWTGATNSDWNTASNWTCSVVPSTTISANIPVVGTVYPLLSSVTGICKDLIVASGASVTVNDTGVLDIAGAINNSGVINTVNGTIAFLGTSAQTIPSNAFQGNTIKNLIINNTAGVTMLGNNDLTGVLTLTAGTFATGNHLTLKSNINTTAMIAPVTGTISGNLTIERFIPSRRAFRFLSSPTTGETIRSNWQEGAPTIDPVGLGTDITGAGGATNGFDVSGSNNPSLYTFLNQNPAAGTSWFASTSTNVPMVAGVPYRILVRGDRTVNQALNNSPSSVTTLRTTGTIKTGDVVVTDLNQNASGFSLIGNPYQAPVDMAAVMTDASSLLNKNFYYVWDPTRNTKGAYVTVTLPAGSNNFSGSVADKYLQPGQACFIQTATAGAPTLTFKESHKHTAIATATIFKAEENPANMVFTLYDSTVLAANGVAADAFVVRFDENYTNEVDAFDAIKPTNQDENIGLMNSGKILSYESRALPVALDIIPISQTQYRTTSYVYKVAVNGISNVNAYLLDKLTNTRTALTNDSETTVPFTVDNAVAESIAANRFDIVFENLLATSENAFANALKIYPNPASDKFFVKLPTGTDGAVNVKLVNTLGQTVYSTTGASENGILKVQPKNTLQSGIYMVHISNGRNTTIEKLIIK
ncbi:T9SS type A sorting domain-containing protein [Flavobacterium noncentrifugens]|uniref:Por secretion system C-terminal sorting domain-containing protein n=1 Tax=Flavobacterium noncentrifugens TaxID=1128970 RepID=A0A1G8WHQ1_9FLAO|nr:T9SS type A sorting domain-containing protein [Flavobacterium noncentrifugens]SDJ77060.1 Por secretion system C-terminal sorting domain-containing protein [Flavobacterium noncentrifugens]